MQICLFVLNKYRIAKKYPKHYNIVIRFESNIPKNDVELTNAEEIDHIYRQW